MVGTLDIDANSNDNTLQKGTIVDDKPYDVMRQDPVDISKLMKDMETLKTICYNCALQYSSITTDFKNIGVALEKFMRRLNELNDTNKE